MKVASSFILTICLITNTFAQDFMIPYRQGNLWGLADYKLNILVEPAYDSIDFSNQYPKGRFVTYKNGKSGVYHRDKLLVSCKLNKVGFMDSTFIIDTVALIGSSHKLMVYNQNSALLFTEPINQITRLKIKDHVVCLVQNNSGTYSLVLYNPINQQITNWIAINQKEIIPYYYKKEEGCVLTFVDSLNAKRHYKLQQDSNSTTLAITELNEDEMTTFLSNDAKRDFRIVEIQKVQTQYQLVEYKKKYYLTTIHHSKPPFVPQKHDKVIAKGKHIISRNYLGNKIAGNGLSLNFHEVEKSDNFLLKKKKGKFQIISSIEKIKTLYDSVIGFSGTYSRPAYFIVGKKDKEGEILKYGIIDIQGKVLIAIENDSIWFNKAANFDMLYNFVLQQNNQFNLFNYKMHSVAGGNYDEIILINDSTFSFCLRQDSLYGYFEQGNFLKPRFIFPVHEQIIINHLKLWKLFDLNGRFLGFADINGHQYFND